MRAQIKKSKRIVIKIGTNVLTDEQGFLDEHRIKSIIRQIAEIKKDRDVVIVTSGAIGSGMSELGLTKRPRDVRMQQACAAIGQKNLMAIYAKHFNEYKIKTAQLLLTYDAFSDRKAYLNLKNCIETLLKLGVIPIVNENDPLSIDEIGPSFGDNDRLSALVAIKSEADLLIILTTVDGLYDKDPTIDQDAEMLKEVIEIDKRIESLGGKPKQLGLGGMATKIKAAKIATSSGISVVFANGRKENTLVDISDGKGVGTFFHSAKKRSGKKSWIMQSKPKGAIIIDGGALGAIRNGKNLLPAGIEDVKGNFNINDVIEIYCKNELCAKATVDYSSEDLKKTMKKSTKEAEKILGREIKNVVKRENLVFIS